AISPVLLADDGKNFTVSDGTTTTGTVALATGDTVEVIAQKINTAAGANSTLTASVENGKLKITSTTGATVSLTDGGVAGAGSLLGFGSTTYSSKSVDDIVTAINNTAALDGKVRASNDGGKLRIENQSTSD